MEKGTPCLTKRFLSSLFYDIWRGFCPICLVRIERPGGGTYRTNRERVFPQIVYVYSKEHGRKANHDLGFLRTKLGRCRMESTYATVIKKIPVTEDYILRIYCPECDSSLYFPGQITKQHISGGPRKFYYIVGTEVDFRLCKRFSILGEEE